MTKSMTLMIRLYARMVERRRSYACERSIEEVLLQAKAKPKKSGRKGQAAVEMDDNDDDDSHVESAKLSFGKATRAVRSPALARALASSQQLANG
jgi:hypothetical protein